MFLFKVLISIATLLFIDFSNLDSSLHKIFCKTFDYFFVVSCTDYYDLPIWDLAVAIGTLTAAYYAYVAVNESAKRLKAEQEPDVRLKDHLTTTAQGFHTISMMNYGKGSAINITATADPSGKNSIIDGSNPHSINLVPYGHNTGWAVDNTRIFEGLREQGKLWSAVEDIPSETTLSEEEKDQADFYLYLWYEDQIGAKYRTTTKFRRSGPFFKVMENRVERISKIL